MSNSRTSLSPTNRTVLHRLEGYVETLDEEAVLTRKLAIECLTDGEFEQAEAHQQIEQLLLKGYLYEVDEALRIPPRPYE